MKVEFENNDTYITESLFQWDLNQELYITGMKVDVAPVFHFSNRKSTESIRVQSYMEEGNITCVIPNQLTKEPYNIIAVAVSYANQKETAEYRIEIPIRTRVMPEDYYMTQNVPILTYESIEADINSAFSKADTKISGVSKRVDTIIAQSGTSDTEVVASRVNALYNKQYDVLSERLDTEYDEHHVLLEAHDNDLKALARIIQLYHPESTDSNFASENNIVSQTNYIE